MIGALKRSEKRVDLAKQHQELIAREGWIFFFPLVALTLGLVLWRVPFYWSLLAGILAFYVAYFFRNPYRKIPDEPNAIVSPADGKVVAVRKLEDGRFFISVFLNIFNVHINRSPIAGTVASVRHTRGKFLAAYKPEASEINEQNALVIQDGDFKVEVIQIAGLIARRIICWTKAEDNLAKGERFGLIRFGSRVDIFLPDTCEVLVHEGQTIKGGSDLLGRRR